MASTKTSPVLPDTLSECRIPGMPDTAYYIPNFITPEEEKYIIETFNTRPASAFRNLSNRRLQIYPGPLDKNNVLLAGPLPKWVSEPVISRILSVPLSSSLGNAWSKDASTTEHIFSDSPHGRPNHCLLNEYEPGQGIMPHTDGPAYYPVVATVSLGASTVLDIYQRKKDGTREPEPKWRILQEPRSLLITTDSIYKDNMHGIAETDVDRDVDGGNISNWSLIGLPEDIRSSGDDESNLAGGISRRETRISLTYRDVNAVKDFRKILPALPGLRK